MVKFKKEPMSNHLITIQTFMDPHDAHLAKGQLEAEGLFCFLKNETAINAIPILSNGMGWIELQVGEGNVNQAKQILS